MDAVLASAANGVGGALVITGDAGLGKSRLMGEARRRAGDHGLDVHAARADVLEATFPFGVVMRLFDRVLRMPPQERAALLDGAAGLAAPLLEAGRGAGPWPDERPLPSLFHGLQWLTENLADRRPLVLAVDDAHWADVPSLRFLHYLLQRIDELPVAVLVATRPTERDPSGRLVHKLRMHPASQTVTLDPLSATAAAELVRSVAGAATPGDVCATCAQVTGGNPLYLVELAAGAGAGTSSDDVVRMAGLDGNVVASVIRSRIAGLPAGAGDLAEAVAVLGDGARLEHAAAVASVAPADAARLTTSLASASVLSFAPELAYRHPLVREAVLAGLAPPARAHLHRRAAAVLAEAGADPEHVGRHLLAAGPGGDPAAEARALRAAGGAAAGRGGPETAAEYLRAAVGRLAHPDAELLVDLARAEVAARTPSARERARDAVAGAVDGESGARLALELGLAFVHESRPDDATALFDFGLEVLGDHDGDEALAAHLRGARAALGGFDAALTATGEGLEWAASRAHARRATLPERVALSHAALAAGMAGEDRARCEELARAAIAGGVDDGEVASGALTEILAATALLLADALAEAEAVLDDVAARARDRGLALVFASAAHARAHVRHRRGRLSDALADVETTLDAVRYGWDLALPSVHAAAALCHLETGDLDAAEAALVLADGDERWEASFTFNDLLEARARVALARGRPDEALDLATTCGERLAEIGADHAAVVPWRSTAAMASAALGDPTRARELAAADLESARRWGAPGPLGLALRTAGALSGGDRGIALLREAVDVLSRSDARLERAHALCDLGATLLDQRHRLAARDVLLEALDVASSCGAAALSGRAKGLLVEAGARPRRDAITGRDALTGRERQIAAMAAAGHSNREIAEGLFITRKTVETHLANVYLKLGITGRGDLAARL